MCTFDAPSKPSRIGLADMQALLMDKIKRLESELEQALAIAHEAQRRAIGNVLRPLRRHEAILLYFGDESLEEFSGTLSKQFSEETVNDILQNALPVDAIRLSGDQIDALRRALKCRNGGLGA